jgi:triosephosphate isomerase
MRRSFIGGNWKMNGTAISAVRLVSSIFEKLDGFSAADVVVFPSYVHIPMVAHLLKESNVNYGAQNVSEFSNGAKTGEISAEMLTDMACQYVLLGHSERRNIQNETDSQVAKKFSISISNKLIPILCVGETLEERQTNKTKDVILRQINTVIKEVGIDAFRDAVIAYEPVWAIGTGMTATPDQAQEIHAFIRSTLADINSVIANQLRIIYGGSANADNAKLLFSMPDIDGGLIGGASLDAEAFSKICFSVKENV